eukprot:418803_1
MGKVSIFLWLWNSVIMNRAFDLNQSYYNEPYTMSLVNTPYYVNTNLTFKMPVTIENGVEIIFNDNVYIYFEDDIICGCNDINTLNNHQRGTNNTQFVEFHQYTNWIHSNDQHGYIVIDTKNKTNKTNRIQFCNTKFHELSTAIYITPPQNADITINNCEFYKNDWAIGGTNHDKYHSKFATFITNSVISTPYIGIQFNGEESVYYDNILFFNYSKFCGTYGCTNVAIRNSEFSHCGVTIRLSSFIGDKTMAFYNNTISNCQTGLIISKDIIEDPLNVLSFSFIDHFTQDLYITNNKFLNIRNGINIEWINSTTIYILHNIFENMHNRAILSENNLLHNLTISNNYFKQNITIDGLVYLRGNIAESILILCANKFMNIKSEPEALLIEISGEYNIYVESNEIKNIEGASSISIDILHPGFIGHYVKFVDNLFESCRISLRYYDGLNTVIAINHNVFNHSSYIYFDIQENALIDMQYNSFYYGSYVIFWIFIFDTENVTSETNLRYNNFYDSKHVEYFIDVFSTEKVIADRNYYDSISDINQIKVKIKDICNRTDSHGRDGQIEIIPYYAEPIDFNDVSNLPTEWNINPSWNCTYKRDTICMCDTTTNVFSTSVTIGTTEVDSACSYTISTVAMVVYAFVLDL